MTRFTFPDNSDRLIYQPGVRRGTALLSERGTEFAVWEQAEGGDLADITTIDNEPIEGSLIAVDDDSMLPFFLGPDGATTVYVQQVGQDGRVEIHASYSEQMHLTFEMFARAWSVEIEHIRQSIVAAVGPAFSGNYYYINATGLPAMEEGSRKSMVIDPAAGTVQGVVLDDANDENRYVVVSTSNPGLGRYYLLNFFVENPTDSSGQVTFSNNFQTASVNPIVDAHTRRDFRIDLYGAESIYDVRFIVSPLATTPI